MKREMTVLIVDDLEKKREEIKRKVAAYTTTANLNFIECDSYETARDKLKESIIDFLILDLMIPAGSDEPSERWSRNLLHDVVDGSFCFPMHVFGLTEHEDLVEEVQHFYDRNIFGLFVFRWEGDEWAQLIAGKIDYLVSAVENGAAYRLNSYDYDLLILTARFESEFKPIKEYLFGRSKSHQHPLWKNDNGVHFGRLKVGPKKFIRTALICIGETGLAPAAAVTSQAINLLRPKYVTMLGMCAGFKSKGLRLLDVIIARETACWQEGKSLELNDAKKFDPRGIIRSWSKDAGEKLGRSFEVDLEKYREKIEKKKNSVDYMTLLEKFGELLSENLDIKQGLLVSGSSVVANAEVRSEVEDRYKGALGLEMETFAVYTSARLTIGSKPEYFAIKGVADLADGSKSDDAQPFASVLSAAVLSASLPLLFD